MVVVLTNPEVVKRVQECEIVIHICKKVIYQFLACSAHMIPLNQSIKAFDDNLPLYYDRALLNF